MFLSFGVVGVFMTMVGGWTLQLDDRSVCPNRFEVCVLMGSVILPIACVLFLCGYIARREYKEHELQWIHVEE